MEQLIREYCAIVETASMTISFTAISVVFCYRLVKSELQKGKLEAKHFEAVVNKLIATTEDKPNV